MCRLPPPPPFPPAVGEHWDVTEQMDTYYNPIPHFGYNLALEHSPQVEVEPRAEWEASALRLCARRFVGLGF